MATLWAALFHLLFGKGWVKLVMYWFVGLAGFAVGQAVADALHMRWLMVGQVHVIEATLSCWIAMFVVRWLEV